MGFKHKISYFQKKDILFLSPDWTLYYFGVTWLFNIKIWCSVLSLTGIDHKVHHNNGALYLRPDNYSKKNKNKNKQNHNHDNFKQYWYPDYEAGLFTGIYWTTKTEKKKSKKVRSGSCSAKQHNIRFTSAVLFLWLAEAITEIEMRSIVLPYISLCLLTCNRNVVILNWMCIPTLDSDFWAKWNVQLVRH